MKMIKLKILAVMFSSILMNQVNAQMKMSAMPDFDAKPVYESNNAGISMKVWIMSIVRDMNSSEAIANVSDDDNDKSTHNVLIQVENQNGSLISEENVKLLMVTPSGKKESVDLDQKSDLYGGSLALLEQGEYRLTVSVNENGKPSQETFSYKIER